ncbi:hypothetical protein pb186bvf_021099 [Paramecium bursaria]
MDILKTKLQQSVKSVIIDVVHVKKIKLIVYHVNRDPQEVLLNKQLSINIILVNALLRPQMMWMVFLFVKHVIFLAKIVQIRDLINAPSAMIQQIGQQEQILLVPTVSTPECAGNIFHFQIKHVLLIVWDVLTLPIIALNAIHNSSEFWMEINAFVEQDLELNTSDPECVGKLKYHIISLGEQYNQCLTCSDSDFRIQQGNECVCKPKYIDNGEGVCMTCSDTCETCAGQKSLCTSCPANSLRTLNVQSQSSKLCECNNKFMIIECDQHFVCLVFKDRIGHQTNSLIIVNVYLAITIVEMEFALCVIFPVCNALVLRRAIAHPVPTLFPLKDKFPPQSAFVLINISTIHKIRFANPVHQRAILARAIKTHALNV